jgi:hypothetical protein
MAEGTREMFADEFRAGWTFYWAQRRSRESGDGVDNAECIRTARTWIRLYYEHESDSLLDVLLGQLAEELLILTSDPGTDLRFALASGGEWADALERAGISEPLAQRPLDPTPDDLRRLPAPERMRGSNDDDAAIEFVVDQLQQLVTDYSRLIAAIEADPATWPRVIASRNFAGVAREQLLVIRNVESIIRSLASGHVDLLQTAEVCRGVPHGVLLISDAKTETDLANANYIRRDELAPALEDAGGVVKVAQ